MSEAMRDPGKARGSHSSNGPGERRGNAAAQDADTLSPEELRAAQRLDEFTRLPTIDPKSYRITGSVGQGGIGRILRAHDERLDRPVAIKELLTAAGRGAEERFVREALLTARLQHPSIVPLYEAGRWPGGAPFYAMKYVSGRSLADVIFERRALPQRLGLLPHVLAVAEAMAYAHSEGIIHRDLKPANILVGAFGETVVIDWGLAKDIAEDCRALSAPPDEIASEPPPSGVDACPERQGAALRAPISALTMRGAVMGTPAYMPLEQATGKPVDARADVYALGAILYHLLAGACPYDGDSSVGILRKVIAAPPPPLEQRQKGISQDLLTIVKKAMARDPADRYPSAKELADDLRRFQTGQIVGAHKYSSIELFRRFTRRYRAALSVGIAALVLLAITGGVSIRKNFSQRYRAEAGEAAALRAERQAIAHADDLTLVQARAAAERDPNEALSWLKSLSPSFTGWPEARLIAADAQARGIATVLRGHMSTVNDVVFAPDGKQIATTSDDHTVRLWDVSTGEARVLSGHTDEVWQCRFSPSGRLLVSSSKDRSIRVWDAATGELRWVLLGHEKWSLNVLFIDEDTLASSGSGRFIWIWNLRTGQGHRLAEHSDVNGVALSPNRKQMVISGDDKLLRIHDLERGETQSLGRHEERIVGIVFTRDGKRVIGRDAKGVVVKWDIATGKSRRLAERSPKWRWFEQVGLMSNSFILSPDGALIARAGEGTSVRLLDVETGADRSLEGHQGQTISVSFSPDGKLLASGSYDHTVHLWDLSSGHSRVLYGFKDAVTKTAFSPDGTLLAAISADHTLRLFPVTLSSGQVLIDDTAPLIRVVFSPNGERVAAGGQDGKIRLRRRAGGASTLLDGHTAPVRNVVFSPSGELLASSGEDQIMHVWDLAGHPLWSTESFPSKSGAPIAFSPDGQLIGVQDRDGTVKLMNVNSGVVRTLVRHKTSVSALVFSPDSKVLATGSSDGGILLSEVASGESRSFSGHELGVLALAFSPDGKTLASGSIDHTFGLWDVATGEGRRADASGRGVEQVTFSADGKVVVTLGLRESGVRVWDVATGVQRMFMRGHAGVVQSFSLSPDGSRLATASIDGTVRLWNLASGESRVMRGHTAEVVDVAFSPDGKWIASASEDQTVRLWPDDLPEDGPALRSWIEAATPDTIDLYHRCTEQPKEELPIR
jgi:eukaryotic-like serine/threonine-protein kinase